MLPVGVSGLRSPLTPLTAPLTVPLTPLTVPLVATGTSGTSLCEVIVGDFFVCFVEESRGEDEKGTGSEIVTARRKIGPEFLLALELGTE